METGSSLCGPPRGSQFVYESQTSATSRKGNSRQQRRKRAKRACAMCHQRKVRCDVTQRGEPCTNCSFDELNCFVKPRAYRPRTFKPPSAELPVAPVPSSTRSLREEDEEMAANQEMPSTNSSGVSTETLLDQHHPQHEYMSDSLEMPLIECLASPFGQSLFQDIDMERSDPFDFNLVSSNAEATPTSDGYSGTPSFEPSHGGHKTIHFSYYPFLKLSTGSPTQLSPEEFNFFDKQGCFTIPTKPALDEFVREYFLHVHPNLPILNEGHFWTQYGNSETQSLSFEKIPLFLFRAMLFASSTFVSEKTLTACGFKSARAASSKLYRLAKLLFDFEVENDSICLAQGALLLTYFCPKGDKKKTNSFWLGVAIQAARMAGAQNYDVQVDSMPTPPGLLKRIWWCCILRDRILPLGMRRPLQITPAHFDFSKACLTVDDFEDEITTSRVYDAKTKRFLIQILISQCRLAIPLTDVIMTVYHLSGCNSFKFATHEEFTDHLEDIEQSKSRLDDWFDDTVHTLPSKASSLNTHESVTLYTGLTYIYYHSARMALCQHQALAFESAPTCQNRFFKDTLSNVKSELKDAEAGITETAKELVQLDLAKNLPISAMAFTALPLVLYTLSLKLSPTDRQRAIVQRRLDIFQEMLKTATGQHDAVELLSEVVKMTQEIGGAYSEASLRPSSVDGSDSGTSLPADPESPSPVADWSELFVQAPRTYLRLVLLLDITFDKGRPADENDYPSVLQRTKLCKATEVRQFRDFTPSTKGAKANVASQSATALTGAVIEQDTGQGGGHAYQNDFMAGFTLWDPEGGLDDLFLDGDYTQPQ